MKKRFRIMVLLLSAAAVGCPGGFLLAEDNPPEIGSIEKLKLVSESGDAKLYRADKVNVAVLKGTYYQMGVQYGTLLKDQIRKFYDVAINQRFIKREGIPYEMIESFSAPAFDFYPQRLQDIIRGISDSSGLEIDKLMILEMVLSITFLKSEEGSGCSSLACWKDYTGGRPLVLGRNYDSTEYFKEEFAPYMNIIVYHPVDGVPTAALCYPGEVTSFTCMNRGGVFFENNEGMKSGGNIVIENRVPFFAMQLTFLMDYPDLSGFDIAMNTTRSNYAFITTAADKDAASVYEIATFGMKKRTAAIPGLISATNHFIDPSWSIAPPFPDAADRTVQRWKNLLALGEKYKGKIDADQMMRIMDTPFDKGGATWPERTAYQVVVVPEKLHLWLQLPGYQEWVGVDLAEVFADRQ